MFSSTVFIDNILKVKVKASNRMPQKCFATSCAEQNLLGTHCNGIVTHLKTKLALIKITAHIVLFLSKTTNKLQVGRIIFEKCGASAKPEKTPSLGPLIQDANTDTEGHLLAFWPPGSGFHTSQREGRARKQVCVKKQPGQQLKAQQHGLKTTLVVSPLQPLNPKLHRRT